MPSNLKTLLSGISDLIFVIWVFMHKFLAISTIARLNKPFDTYVCIIVFTKFYGGRNSVTLIDLRRS